MSALDLDVKFTDRVSPELQARFAALQNRRPLHAEMGFAVELLVIRHLRTTKALEPNRLGAPSTGYWQQAISSVIASADDDAAKVSIPHRGVALHYYGSAGLPGGVVRPTKRGALTIPISMLAHGKRVSDFPKGSLFKIRSKKGNDILAMRDGKSFIPLFVLRASVTMKADKNVLPTPAQLRQAALAAAKAYLNRGGRR